MCSSVHSNRMQIRYNDLVHLKENFDEKLKLSIYYVDKAPTRRKRRRLAFGDDWEEKCDDKCIISKKIRQLLIKKAKAKQLVTTTAPKLKITHQSR